jgi:DNA-binding MarR family transcriptional regulator
MDQVDLDYTDAAVRQWSELEADRDLSRFEVGTRIERLARALRTEIEREIASLGFSVYGDYEVISALRRAQGPLQPSEIAERLMLTRAGVTGRLDRLGDLGLIERQQVTEDGRAVHVTLSTAGRRTADKAFQRIVAAQDHMLEPLENQQVRTLSELLRVIAQPLDPASDTIGLD